MPPWVSDECMDRPESLRLSGYRAQQLLEASGRTRVNRLLVENDLNTLIGWYENFSSVKVVVTTIETKQSSIDDIFSYALPFLALTKRERLMCDFSLGSIHNLSRGWAMMISLFFPFIFLKPPLIISGVFFLTPPLEMLIYQRKIS